MKMYACVRHSQQYVIMLYNQINMVRPVEKTQEKEYVQLVTNEIRPSIAGAIQYNNNKNILNSRSY